MGTRSLDSIAVPLFLNPNPKNSETSKLFYHSWHGRSSPGEDNLYVMPRPSHLAGGSAASGGSATGLDESLGDGAEPEDSHYLLLHDVFRWGSYPDLMPNPHATRCQ